MNKEAHVLVVEDDETLRFLIGKQMAKLKQAVDFATNGKQAVEMSKQGYDLIFMDIGLPELNGLEATQTIREQELKDGRPRTPIVAMTAYSEHSKAAEVGMDDYLLKPVLMDQFKVILEKWLAQHFKSE